MTLPRRSLVRRAGAGSGWRRILPVLFVLGLLALAPAFALAQAADSVVVRWSAPGDDGAVGTAAVYDLRVSQSPITPANFAQALSVPGVPAPLPSGRNQRVSVFGLTRGNTYYFAIRTADDAGNWSALSNVVKFDWALDTSPPAPPHGVQVLAQSDGVHLSWSPNAEADLAGYNVYRSENGGSLARLNDALLTVPRFVDTTAPPGGNGADYAVTAVDQRGNESARTLTPTIGVAIGTAWELRSGYPNPSHLNESVHIPVTVPATASGPATVQILDAAGRLVRRLVLSNPVPGSTELSWDGLNDAGRATAPGLYRGWLVAGDARSSVRLLRVP